MGVAEHAAVEILRGVAFPPGVRVLVQTGVAGQRGLARGPRLGRGAGFRAAVLDEQVLDALHGRVVRQVTPAGSGTAAGTQGIGPERTTVPGVPTRTSAQVQSGCHELRITPQDPTLRPY